MTRVRKYFEQIGFGGEDLEKILAAFVLQEFRKNDFIVEEGKTSRHIGLVETGMVQYYVIKDGEERTTYVSIENTFFSSVLSFISEQPAQENIKFLTDGSISMNRFSRPSVCDSARS